MNRSTYWTRLAACVVACVSSVVGVGASHAQSRCEAPRVLLVVDKSSSMLGRVGGTTKWEAARTAISALADEFSSRMELGLMPFPYPDRCAPGTVTLDLGANDGASLLGALGAPPPDAGNWTPMAQTLEQVAAYAPMRDATRDAHVVLITDGWQWCSPYSASTRFTPVNAVQRLREAGITVHVVGFGDGVDALTLNRAAVAAGTGRAGCDPTLDDPRAAGHCYFQANALDELEAALAAIARTITDEVCDGFDNDCDGVIDDGFDVDGDGYTTCGSDVDVPGELDTTRIDCVDTNADIHPFADERCNGLDDDCDGDIDPGCDCADGATIACGSDVGACAPGTQRCEGGRWQRCEDATTPSVERCNALDDDCDGRIDDDAPCAEGAVCLEGTCTFLGAPAAIAERPLPATEVIRTPEPSQAGGCTCRVHANQPASPLALSAGLATLLVTLTVRRRRRRRSSPSSAA